MNQCLSSHAMFFLGIGGIGMSALARYFKAQGVAVVGYDRTTSPLTQALEQEGITVVYSEQDERMSAFLEQKPVIIYTPAIHPDDAAYQACARRGLTFYKRAQVLGLVTRQKKALCVAGTHGKTTTSTLLAHILHNSSLGANAFLGGISNNYSANLLLDPHSEYVVVEADEYDHSFMQLQPYMSVITSIDPDHLDIYGDERGYQQGFAQYAALVEHTILLKQGYQLLTAPSARVLTYAGIVADQQPLPDCYASDLVVQNGQLFYTLHLSDGEHQLCLEHVTIGVPAYVNIENSVAAAALAWLNGASEQDIRRGLASYAGVLRRFNVKIHSEHLLLVDDYAHHPTELQASIDSIRFLYPQRYTLAVFQPHLYTRTRDFLEGFARVLGSVDELILLPIYPAREAPIEGVNSQALAQRAQELHPHCRIRVMDKNELTPYLCSAQTQHEALSVLMLGAGDIDRLVEPVRRALDKA